MNHLSSSFKLSKSEETNSLKNHYGQRCSGQNKWWPHWSRRASRCSVTGSTEVQISRLSKALNYMLWKLQTIRVLLQILRHSFSIFSLETLLHSQPIPPLQFVLCFCQKMSVIFWLNLLYPQHFKHSPITCFWVYTQHAYISISMFLYCTWSLIGTLDLEKCIYITVPTKLKLDNSLLRSI